MRKPLGKPGGFLLEMDTTEETIRGADPDRFYAALFAPAPQRPALLALYALNTELARVAENAREPMMIAIRLQWWREAVEGAREGTPRAHDVVRALAHMFETVELPQNLFDSTIDAREMDAAEHEFADMAALEDYCDLVGGNLMRLAARALAQDNHDDLARHAGIAHALTGILRAIPFHASRRKVYLPQDLLRAAGTSRDDILATHSGKKLGPVIAQIADTVRSHLSKSRALTKPGAALPAFLPATPVSLYLKRVTKPGFDAFKDETDVPLFRKQFAMLRASWRGQV